MRSFDRALVVTTNKLVNNSFEPWHLMRSTRTHTTALHKRKYGWIRVKTRINVPKLFKWYSMRIVQIMSNYTWKARRILHFHFHLFANGWNLCGTQFRYHFNVCHLFWHPYFVNGLDSIKSTVKSNKIRFTNKPSAHIALLICVLRNFLLFSFPRGAVAS